MEGILDRFYDQPTTQHTPGGVKLEIKKGWNPHFFIMHDTILMYLSEDKTSGVLGKVHLGVSKII
jgi:hypothetical protein